MRAAAVAAMVVAVSAVPADRSGIKTPAGWETTWLASDVNVTLQAVSDVDQGPIQGQWKIARTLGELAGDPSVPFSCQFLFGDTDARSAGSVTFTISLDGKSVHREKVRFDNDTPRYARAVSARLDLSRFEKDSVVACAAKVASPAKVKAKTVVQLGLTGTGSMNQLDAGPRSASIKAPIEPPVPSATYDTPGNWTRISSFARSRSSLMARASKSASPIKGAWTMNEPLGEAAGNPEGRVVCTMAFGANVPKGKAKITILIDGDRQYRKTVPLAVTTQLVMPETTDFGKYSEDSEAQCQVKIKSGTRIPGGSSVFVHTFVYGGAE